MIPNADITIYNKYTDPSTRSEKYQRSVIQGVVWESTSGSAEAKDWVSGVRAGKLPRNAASLFIPITAGGAYLAPIAWQALTVKSGYWTLQADDVIVRGAVTDEITEAVIDPPAPAFTMTDLREKYDDIVGILAVDLMDRGSIAVRHWAVDCR